MTRFQRAMQTEFVRSGFGLTASQLFILRYLTGCGQAKASDIAKMSGLSPGAVTQVCDELVKVGLVDRSRSTDDRRVVYITITVAGRERFEGIRRKRSEKLQDILYKLGVADAQEFARILSRVVDIVETDLSTKR